MRSRSLVAALATVVLLLPALPAGAHPFFRDGATVPADSLATVTLAMAHGCGDEGAGGGDPTLEVAIEVPPSFTFLEAAPVDGYDVEVEGDGPVPEVVTYVATDGGVPAPEFDLDVVIAGGEGDEVYVRVLQGCEGFRYRWVGTPDEPADDPAVRLTLTAPDPASPPPDPDPEPDPEPDPAADDGAAATDDVSVEDLPAEPPEEEGTGGLPWLVLLVGGVVLAALGALLGGRWRPDPGGPGTTGDPGAPDDPSVLP